MQTLYQVTDRVSVVRLSGTDEADCLIRLLEQIADEQAWQMGNGLRVCQATAEHLAITVDGTIIGGLQAVSGTTGGPLPHRHVWPDVDVSDSGHALHVTMMALDRQHRGHAFLFWPLCVELWRWCVREGVETILLECTPPTLRVYRRLGWPLEIVGDLRPHWGEECYLCRNSVRQVAEAITARATRSETYKALVQQGRRNTSTEEDTSTEEGGGTPVDAAGAALP